MYNEGAWGRDYQESFNDSANKQVDRDENAPQLGQNNTISLATILLPEPEPVFKQHSIVVDMVKNGIVTGVAWPGAQVNANAAGLPGGLAIGIHGLFEAPLSGQQVAIGFIDGSQNNPVVLAKYGYNSSQRIDLEAMHFLPMTTKAHGPTDVVLGHHTGSYIALRGTLPLPGEIDIVSPTVITMSALAAITVTVGLGYTVTVGGAYTVAVTGAVSITAGATIGLTSTGIMTLTASAMVLLPTPATILTIGTGVEAMLKGTTALVELTKDNLLSTALASALATWTPVLNDGGTALKLALTAYLLLPTGSITPSLLSTKVLAE